MKTMLGCLVACLALAASAADEKAPSAGAMDMSKMGPWTRKADEGKVKKDIEKFLSRMDAAEHDLQAQLTMIDYPVFMVTDSASGGGEAEQWSREKYEQTMKPFFENAPKEMKVTHKRSITVLSDALANVTDDFTMTTGGKKLSGRNTQLLIKRNGEWKVKSMVEAGWGGGPQQQQAATTK